MDMTIMSFGYQGTKSGCYTISSLNHEAHGSFWGSGTIKRSKMPCWTFRSMLDYLKSGQSKTMLHSVIFLWQYNVILPLFSSFRTDNTRQEFKVLHESKTRSRLFKTHSHFPTFPNELVKWANINEIHGRSKKHTYSIRQ